MMTVKQVLTGAAKRLQEKGWTQGCYGKMAEEFASTDGFAAVPAGSPCGAGGNLVGIPVAETDVIGALRQQAGWRASDAANAIVDEAKALLRRHLAVDNLATWNDEEGRTKEQVIAALKAAARA
jgi:hypothetical protein